MRPPEAPGHTVGRVDGLIACGSVVGRSRRLVGAKEKELVTYRLASSSGTLEVDAWEPEAYFGHGEEVKLPVSIRIYITRAGYPAYRLTLATADSGEEF